MRCIEFIISLIKRKQLKFLISGIIKRLNSEVISIGLKRDLNSHFECPNALIDLNIRLAKESDHSHFFEENTNFGLIEKNIKSCYVATTKDDNPCFRIWLMEPSQNEKIQSFFRNFFPIVKKNEALLEGAFTPSSYRGKRIMPAAISRISEKGIEFGARYILIFVDLKNIPSLKSCKRAGLLPYTLRLEKWFLCRRKVTFTDISPEILKQYNAITTS